jgi:CHAT domain-containing protein
MAPTASSRQKFLASTGVVPRSLASDAASSAIEEGQIETAVELLERGRTILWSKMQGYRQPLEELRDKDRELADRFEEVSRELEHHSMSSNTEFAVSSRGSDGPQISYDTRIQRHHILSEEWDVLVGRIRKIEGLEIFLRAVPFTTLQSSAKEGPVIIVNISEYCSDAIILHNAGPPELVCLPDASPDTLAQLSTQLYSALTSVSNRWERMIPVLRQLWDRVVSLVADKLTALGVAKRTRIWWCPTSESSGLPLHAAGPYIKGRNLSDKYISSYMPTLSSLIKARSSVHNLASPRLFVMGQPNDDLESARLPHVREEIRRISNFGNFVDVLVGEKANQQAVLSLLQQYPWIHFACHGHLDVEPFLSYFQLHGDEKLTLIDLIKARLPNAEFAFLSACHSAAIDIYNTPDETIHLATALQFCGFRGVVGTMWKVADIDGPDVAEEFYRHMFRNPDGGVDFRDSAMALNEATRVMRRKGTTVDRWINFVHIGA